MQESVSAELRWARNTDDVVSSPAPVAQRNSGVWGSGSRVRVSGLRGTPMTSSPLLPRLLRERVLEQERERIRERERQREKECDNKSVIEQRERERD